MKEVKDIINLLLNKIIELVSIILKSTKLNLLKIKIALFTLIMGAFTWNYFIILKKNADGSIEFNFTTPETHAPIGVFLILAILVWYLVRVDVIQIEKSKELAKELLLSNNISETLKKELIDEIKK